MHAQLGLHDSPPKHVQDHNAVAKKYVPSSTGLLDPNNTSIDLFDV
jgi:hypothetical protein